MLQRLRNWWADWRNPVWLNITQEDILAATEDRCPAFNAAQRDIGPGTSVGRRQLFPHDGRWADAIFDGGDELGWFTSMFDSGAPVEPTRIRLRRVTGIND